MRSKTTVLQSDLANLFSDLEEAKRDSKNVVSISKPKIDQSDIDNLFSSLDEASKEVKVVKRKRKDFVETTTADITNLFQGLEEASVEANLEVQQLDFKNKANLSEFSDLLETITHAEEPEEKDHIEPSEDNPIDDITSDVSAWIDKTKEEKNKLDALEELLTVSVDQIAKDIEEEEVELLSKLGDNQEPVKEEVNLISGVISQLDDKKKKVDIKEEIDDITTLRKEFDNFRSLIAQQISSSQMSGSGSGEVRLEFLDDVQRTTAKVDGKFLKFDSTLGKFIGADVSAAAAAADLTGNTLASGITASSLTSVGTLTSLAVSGNATIAGNLTVSGTTTTVNKTVVNVEEAFIFEGATADAHETTFRINEPTTDRIASLQDKTGTIALLSGFRLDATDGSASDDGDFLVLNTSADENDRLLFEDGTSDPLSVLASHGITLSGQGWNAFQFDNT
jgi:roadblock/LC7 domain-containing protein